MTTDTSFELGSAVGIIHATENKVNIKDDGSGSEAVLDTDTILTNFPNGATWKAFLSFAGKVNFLVSNSISKVNRHEQLHLQIVELEVDDVTLQAGVDRRSSTVVKDSKGDLVTFLPGADKEDDLLPYSIEPFAR